MMKKQKSVFSYFSKGEIVLWCSSIMLIVVSFAVFDRVNYMTLIASVIGATSLIFNAKGNPIGQVLMIIFSVMYGIIIILVFILRRDDHLLRDDSTDVYICTGFLVEESI